MKLRKMFRSNRQREQEGVVVEMDGDGAWVRVARDNNERFQKEARKIFKPHRAAIQQGTIDGEMLRRLTCKAVAAGILLDWGGMTDDDDKPLPYSKEAAEQELFDNPDFAEYVATLSKDRTLFQDEPEDVEEKNSAPGTPGN